MKNNSFLYIDTDKKLNSYTASLEQREVKIIALDIEGEYNLHHYGEHLCLVQIFDRENCIIIDPQTVSDNLIQKLFENTGILKIMYDCSTDRTLMYRKYGINIKSVLDLYPAAELLGYEKKGLGSVLNRHFSHESKSKNRYQKYNWMKRPVDQGALDYAAEDVLYLFDLKEKMIQELISADLLDEYILKNIEAQTRPVLLDPVPGILRKGRYKKLPSKSKKLFLQLYEKREMYAEKLDLPPNSVVSNNDLFSLASGSLGLYDIVYSKNIERSISEKLKSDISKII